jgi:hypothetical protein
MNMGINMEDVLFIGAPTEYDPVINTINYWHGMVSAIRNTVNVPKYDRVLEYRAVFEQGERLRGSSITSRPTKAVPRGQFIQY